jgi:hypothetical protein
MKYNTIPSYFHHYHILSNIILFAIAHPGSRIPKRLTITWLVKKSVSSYRTHDSFSCSQEYTTGSYTGTYEFSPYTHTCLKGSLQQYLLIYKQHFKWPLTLWFPIKILFAFFIPYVHAICPTQPTLLKLNTLILAE